nr:fimbria/pilus outer membrane usher protein [Azospirillum sp. SYSU D00513]
MAFAFDPAEILVSVTLDPALRRAVELDLRGGLRPPSGNAVVEPAAVSAFTNIGVNEEWSILSDGRTGGRVPLGIAFSHGVNLGGLVLEGASFYDEDGADRWQRGNLRLTKDWVDARLRASAGDLVYPATGFQSGQQVGGFLIARNFQLQPYALYQPTGQQEFILNEPSTVEVAVNGRPTRSYRLPVGSYNLRNFPGTLGTNDVTLRITDAFGRTQTISVPYFFDNQLLAEGIHEFAYAGGLPTRIEEGTYHYERGRPSVSGSHRVGITDRLTLGFNAQADRTQRLFGGELLFATALGTIAVEPAVSSGHGLKSDSAVRVSYRDFSMGDSYWKQRSVTASATWRGAGFAPFGVAEPRNPVRLDLALRVSQPVNEWLTTSLGGRHQFSRDPEGGDASNLELLLRSRLSRSLALDLSVEHNRDADGRREVAGFASLRYSFDGFRQSVGASADTSAGERRLDWRYRDLGIVNTVDAGVQLTRDEDGERAEGDATFVHQRFIATARSSYLSRLEDAESAFGRRSYDRRTALGFSTGLVFADGHVGVTRPVNDSFAIVSAHPRLDGKAVTVDPFEERYTARTDFLGAPVLPDLTAYRQQALLLDVPDAPVNHDLGNDRPVMAPTYRSGTVVPIGTDTTAGLSGVLKDGEGAPLALQSGVLRPLSGGGEILFFSNRQGRFRIEGVRPGGWTLTVFGLEDRPVAITVPPEADALIDLGEVRP